MSVKCRPGTGSAKPTQAMPSGGGSCSQGLSCKELGQRGEDAAAGYLEYARGWQILERNWRCSCGEADIVAYDDDEGCVVLVEVKTRRIPRDAQEVAPELAVDRRKQRKYLEIASIYQLTHPDAGHVRFDVVAVAVSPDGGAGLRHIVGAFDWGA